MHVVAITGLHTSVEDEVTALARDLGTLPYEQRLKLAAGLPAVVLATPDERRADTLAGALRARGHDVVACLASDVVATEDMTELRRYRFEDDALFSTAPIARVPWGDVAVLVRGIHRTSTETREVVTQKRLAIGRAVLSGGIVSSKTTSRTIVGHTDDTEAVLYLFLRSAAPPWILRERRANYDALGPDVTPSSGQNFALVVDQLRTRARGAAFDDRLIKRRGSPAEVDLLAHLIVSSGTNVATPFR